MAIENVMKYLELILKMLPLIDTLISFVEKMFVKLGIIKGGEAKENAVVNAVAALAPDLPESIVRGTVKMLVDMKNEAGDFKHTEDKLDEKDPPGGNL